MAPLPDLDYAAITAPIPGDNPGGSRMPFTLRQKLEAARKDFEPNPDDPSAAPIPKKPDWNGIIRMCLETLTETSKDLETALRLTEALTRQCGLVGLREGFKILTALVRECWDFLHPIPDPEDGEGPEIRAERFNWIGDTDAGARFPHTVREVPLLRVGNRQISLRERQMAYDGQLDGVSADEVDRAQLATDTTAAEIDEVVAAYFELDRVLTERLENNAPGMIGLRQTLEETQTIVQRLAGAAGGATSGGDAEPGTNGASLVASGGAPLGSGAAFSVNLSSVQSREDAYRLIEQIADALQRLEPHSPIPDLLRRALELGRMPFRRLIRELIRDAGNLSQVYREFGIKEEEAPAE